MAVFLTLISVALVLVCNEWWWRTRKPHGELSRKSVHILVGTFVAFWPYFLSWNTIRVFSLAFLVVVVLSKYIGIFSAIHSVTRPTWGEVYFALAVGLVSIVAAKPAIYTAALLQMSLADGLAAIAGTRYGASTGYKIFNAQKSLMGTGTFLIVSYSILLGFHTFSTPIAIPACLGIAIVATAGENIAVKGLDNLLVPILVAVLLRVAV